MDRLCTTHAANVGRDKASKAYSTDTASQRQVVLDRLKTGPLSTLEARSELYMKPKIAKLPAYGKALQDRQRFKNLPFLVVVCVGASCWQDAKQWLRRPDISPMVVTPEQTPSALTWPVSNCICVVDWSLPAPGSLIVEIVKSLLRAGAVSATVWPSYVDHTTPAFFYDKEKPVGERWEQEREVVKTYLLPESGVRYAA